MTDVFIRMKFGHLFLAGSLSSLWGAGEFRVSLSDTDSRTQKRNHTKTSIFLCRPAFKTKLWAILIRWGFMGWCGYCKTAEGEQTTRMRSRCVLNWLQMHRPRYHLVGTKAGDESLLRLMSDTWRRFWVRMTNHRSSKPLGSFDFVLRGLCFVWGCLQYGMRVYSSAIQFRGDGVTLLVWIGDSLRWDRKWKLNLIVVEKSQISLLSTVCTARHTVLYCVNTVLHITILRCHS